MAISNMMKSLIVIIFLFFVSGCSTRYWGDRVRDAADVFTVTGGVGAGAKARIGPFQAATLVDRGIIGLRGGTLFVQSLPIKPHPEPCMFEVAIPFTDVYEGGSSVDAVSLSETARKRGKNYDANGLCYYSWCNASYYYTQIEVYLGLGLGSRLGVNPGELLDFFTGWIGIDIFWDDLAYIDENE